MTAHRKGQPPVRRVRFEPRSAEGGSGYRKPPHEHQFQPGESGNPKGRPKGAKNESTILREILARKIETRSGGRVRKITILEAILLRMTEDSLKGNIRSAAFLLNRYGAMVSGELPVEGIGEDDREVLEAFAKRLQRRTGTKSEEES
jgi:Family of unknown function (DUF5681)